MRGVLTFVSSGLDINVCVLSYFEGDTVIQAVHSLLYIVAKCHFFSVVTLKDIIKYLQKCEGCTHFCQILYVFIYRLCPHCFGYKEKRGYRNTIQKLRNINTNIKKTWNITSHD